PLDARGVRAAVAPATRPARNANGMMRILDRYLLREFMVYLALGLLGFIAIFVVVDIIEKADVFLDHNAPLPTIVRFYLFRALDRAMVVLAPVGREPDVGHDPVPPPAVELRVRPARLAIPRGRDRPVVGPSDRVTRPIHYDEVLALRVVEVDDERRARALGLD